MRAPCLKTRKIIYSKGERGKAIPLACYICFELHITLDRLIYHFPVLPYNLKFRRTNRNIGMWFPQVGLGMYITFSPCRYLACNRINNKVKYIMHTDLT